MSAGGAGVEAGGVPVTGDATFRDPRWAWPEYEDGAVVELRVHGIGGEGPEGMTRDHHPVLVGGDDEVGFWRARNPTAAVAADPDPEPVPRVREVVSWGGSTSGRSRSALWVLLLPFAIFNAAGRMAPGEASDTRYEAHQLVCRLLALSLTVAIVAIATGITHDLLALQCAGTPPCATAPVTGRWLLAPLRWGAEDAAALLAVLSLVPLAVPYGLRFAGRRELAQRPPLADPGPDHHRLRGSRRLDERDAWHNLWPAWRLRGIHVTAGYAWVLLVLARLLPTALPESGAVVTLAQPLAVLLLLACAVLAALPRVAGSAPSRSYGAAVLAVRWATLAPLGLLIGIGVARAAGVRDTLLLSPLLWVVAAAGLGWSTWHHVRHVDRSLSGGSGPSGSLRDLSLLGSAVVAGMLTHLDGRVHLPVVDVAEALPSGDALAEPLLGGLPAAVYLPIWVLVVVQTLLLIALVVTSGGSGSDRTGRGRLPLTTVPGNLGAPVIALVSMLLVSAVGAGLHAFVLDWLGTRVRTPADAVAVAADAAAAAADAPVAAAAADPRAALGLQLPWWYVLTALVVVVTVVLLGLVAAGLWAWLQRTAAPSASDVQTVLGRSLAELPDPATLDPARRVTVGEVVRRTGRQWLHQALVRRAGAALGAVVGTVLVGVVVLAVVVGIEDLATTELPGGTLALAVVAALPPAEIVLLRAARSDRIVRRQIGMLWDVLCFWPRTTHPFSPPSYGEAVVPAVVERLNRYPAASPVVLAGHSQGSVIALAAAVHPALAARRLHLVTYGSPVSLLYEGFFPTVFGGDEGAIARATPTGDAGPVVTWHNVLSVTEPISTPLWAWSDPGPETPADRFGWPVVARLATLGCTACGWRRDAEVATTGDPQGQPEDERRAIDLTVTDPDRVLSPSWEVDGRPAGHSSYHRSRELDLHLAHLR